MRVSRARRPEVEFVVDGCAFEKQAEEREEREGVVFVLAIGSCGRRKTKSCLGFRFRV
jgi:hypothetical protein